MFTKLVKIHDEVEELKNKIARFDAAFLADEMSQLYKKHPKIISRICNKSRFQLARTRGMYTSILTKPGEPHKRTIVDDITEVFSCAFFHYMLSK